MSNYLAYSESSDRWALDRFVVPAARLAELSQVARDLEDSNPLRLSVVMGSEIAAELLLAEAFDARRGRIEAVEARVTSAEQARQVIAALPDRWVRYVEVPVDSSGEGALDVVARAGAFAKVRTGGTTPEAFPHPAALARFLAGCAERRLPFKATAGLHHPLRGSFPLTYHPDATRATMYGYLNVALAAALLWSGRGDLASVPAALTETAPATLHVQDDLLGWRSERFDPAFLAGFRRDFFHGFGSCSFREPLDELAVLTASP